MTSLNGVSLTYLGLIQKADGGVNGTISPLLNESLLAPDPSTVVIQTKKKIGSVMEALSSPAGSTGRKERHRPVEPQVERSSE